MASKLCSDGRTLADSRFGLCRERPQLMSASMRHRTLGFRVTPTSSPCKGEHLVQTLECSSPLGNKKGQPKMKPNSLALVTVRLLGSVLLTLVVTVGRPCA